MHTSYTTEKITQQRMAETAQRARTTRTATSRDVPRRTFSFPGIARRRRAIRIA